MAISPEQKTAIEQVIHVITATKAPRGRRMLCEMFMVLLDKDEWQEYYEVIPEPRCIEDIQTSLEDDVYRDPLAVFTDLSLVFWNAIAFNEDGSQVETDAQALKAILETEWKNKAVLPQPRSLSPPPGSAQKLHGSIQETSPSPEPTPAPPPPPKAEPVVVAPIPKAPPSAPSTRANTSTPAPVATQPMLVTRSMAARLKSPDVDIDVGSLDSDGEVDAEVKARDDELIKHLEKGLPKWPGFGDAGWMLDAGDSTARYIYIIDILKNFKDSTGVRYATALEALPEAPSDIPYLSSTSSVSLRSIETLARASLYDTPRDFDMDMARLFEKGRRAYADGADSYGRLLLLQRLYQALTSANPPTDNPPTSSTNFASLSVGPGNNSYQVTSSTIPTGQRQFVDEIDYRGWSVRTGDWLHLANADDPSRPIVAQVFRCWVSEEASKQGLKGVTVVWYFRPEQTFHPPNRKFWVGEVFKSGHFADHPVEDILEKVGCQLASRHISGRPRGPHWYPGFPLYVCDARYDDQTQSFERIHDWRSCLPQDLGDDHMKIYPFERDIYPSTQASPFVKRTAHGPGGLVPAVQARGLADNSGPNKGRYVGNKTRAGFMSLPQDSTTTASGVDKTVVTAAGGTALNSNVNLQKLQSATTKYFERDADTNEVLWFPGRPVNAPRVATAPTHSLRYLHFLATKGKASMKRRLGETEASEGSQAATDMSRKRSKKDRDAANGN